MIQRSSHMNLLPAFKAPPWLLSCAAGAGLTVSSSEQYRTRARLRCLGWQWAMVITDLLDFAISELDHFGADRFNHLVKTRTSAVEDRFRHAATRITGHHLQITTAVGHRRETGLVMALNLVAALEADASCIDYHRIAMEARHHRFQVVAIEGVEVALNQFFFESHFAHLHFAVWFC